MRHAFTPPTFDSTNAVATRAVMVEGREHAIATGPQFLLAIDFSRNIYGGVELAAGGLGHGPMVIREGVDVSESGFYIGFRAIVGARFELGRLTVGAEFAPGVNDVSFESPTTYDKRGNRVRFHEVRYEIDARTRFDVRVTRMLAIGLVAGAGLFDRHDLSTAVTLRLRPRPR